MELRKDSPSLLPMSYSAFPSQDWKLTKPRTELLSERGDDVLLNRYIAPYCDEEDNHQLPPGIVSRNRNKCSSTGYSNDESVLDPCIVHCDRSHTKNCHVPPPPPPPASEKSSSPCPDGSFLGSSIESGIPETTEELPPGIITLNSFGKGTTTLASPFHRPEITTPVSTPMNTPVRPPLPACTPVEAKNRALVYYENHIVDEELPSGVKKKKKNSGKPVNKARFYQIHRLYCLSAPYQQSIEADRVVHLYTWKLPPPEYVAICTKVDASCFQHTDQTIGLLFSQPIAQSDYVCRVPLYMQFGIMRVRLRRSATWVLSADQAWLAHAAHRQLARLSADVNKPAHLDLNFNCTCGNNIVTGMKSHVDFFSTPYTQALRSAAAAAAAAENDSQTEMTTSPSSASLHSTLSIPPTVTIDPFSELKEDPENAYLCALMVIVKLPSMEFDEEASLALLDWAAQRDYYVNLRTSASCSPASSSDLKSPSPPALPPTTESPSPLLRSNICTRYGLPLSALPRDEWAGRLVRPIDLPGLDPAGFVVLGPNARGHRPTTCLSAISDTMLARLPQELHETGKTTFFDYTQLRHGSLVQLVQKTRSLDLTLPLATIMRISRHNNANYVTSGLCASSKSSRLRHEDRLSEFCIVHPLSAWLWIILCLTPTVLHQVTRCLSVGELANRLSQLLCDEECEEHEGEEERQPTLVPEGRFLMPDRASAPAVNTPSLKKYLDDDWNLKNPSPVFTAPEECQLDEGLGTPEGHWSNGGQGRHKVPPVAALMEAFTTVNALEAVNLERLEVLGDAFLKFCSTLLLYGTSAPDKDEGRLTYERGAYICNYNLHRISAHFGLFRYLAANDFKREIMYMPPNFVPADPENAREVHDNRVYDKVFDKSIADAMEALLGVCLLTLDAPHCARLLALCALSNHTPQTLRALAAVARVSWVPLVLAPAITPHIDPEFAYSDAEAILVRRQVPLHHLAQALLPGMELQAVGESEAVYDLLESQRDWLRPLEDIIGYRFRRIRILLQAITHSSSAKSAFWGCYQRLEFLGDAILDFVVTNRIYKEHPDKDPGGLTDLKVALVSNINLAVVVVRLGIHKFLDLNDSLLQVFIERFTKAVGENYGSIWKLEHDCNERNEMLSYKVLGDMLEAIIGAVFVDSDGSTDIVTSLIYYLLQDEFRIYGERVPMDPLRLMHEMYPELEIVILECFNVTDGDLAHDMELSLNLSPSSTSSSSSLNGSFSKRSVVRVEGRYKEKRLKGEGYNLRTAKLQIALQLGVLVQ